MIELHGQGVLEVSTRYILPVIDVQKMHASTVAQKLRHHTSEVDISSRGANSEVYERKITKHVTRG